MDDGEPILPVVPVLAYANPQGGQPLNGRLAVEHHENGVIVIDPQSAATSPMLLKRMGAILLVLGTLMVVLTAVALMENKGDDIQHLLAAVLAMICGTIAFFRSSRQKQEPRIIHVEPGRVYTTGCPGHDWFSGRFRPRRFVVVDGSIDLKTRRAVCSVVVKYAYRIGFVLIPYLSRDEAIWAVDVLEKALRNETERNETDAGV